MPKFEKSTGFKMKGFKYPGKSPMKQKAKNIPGEDTDVIKTDKKGNEFSLAMYDMDSGINKGDTLFVSPSIPRSDGYVQGGDYKAEETEGSKKRKKGPKSYNLKEDIPKD